MADTEKRVGQANDQLPEHLENMERTRTNIDVVETTTKNPYKELNFIGTYLAIAFATCGAFAGFVMPVTSLTIINADIGENFRSHNHCTD